MVTDDASDVAEVQNFVPPEQLIVSEPANPPLWNSNSVPGTGVGNVIVCADVFSQTKARPVSLIERDNEVAVFATSFLSAFAIVRLRLALTKPLTESSCSFA